MAPHPPPPAAPAQSAARASEPEGTSFPPGTRPRTLKLVFSFDCRHHCGYCALVHARGHDRQRRQRLDPVQAEARILEASARFPFDALEIGAGETFLHPELYEWLVDFNHRHLHLPLTLFGSLVADNAPDVFRILSRSRHPVFMLISYDGRRSLRNRHNWPQVEANYRRMRDFFRDYPQVSSKISACVDPADALHLRENFHSIAALDPERANFNFRPLKRLFSTTQRRILLRQYRDFLADARRQGIAFVRLPENSGPIEYPLKPDWRCEDFSLSLLPDGRWTDCYVTHYCADFPPERTRATFDPPAGGFPVDTPADAERCRPCLDSYFFCNQCLAGLADFRRASGRGFYDRSFCTMVNGLALLTMDHILRLRPGNRIVVRRQGFGGTRINREDDLLEIRPPRGEPFRIDPARIEQDPMAFLPA
jgi:hypothetical protein